MTEQFAQAQRVNNGHRFNMGFHPHSEYLGTDRERILRVLMVSQCQIEV
jgi:hypothetical protein